MKQLPQAQIDELSKQAIAHEVINQLAQAEEDSQPINTLDKPNPDLLGTNESVKIIETLLDDGLREKIMKICSTPAQSV